MTTPQHKALNNKKQPHKDSGSYVSPNGVRYLSKKEQKEKTKGWNKGKGGGTVAFPKTDKQKKEHQNRFGRAWND